MTGQNHGRSNTLLVSLVAGLAGAGLALLLAPRSGRETRAKLRSSMQDLKYQTKDNLNQMKDMAEDTADQAREMKDKVASAIKTRKRQTDEKLEPPLEKPEASNKSKKSPLTTSWDEEI